MRYPRRVEYKLKYNTKIYNAVRHKDILLDYIILDYKSSYTFLANIYLYYILAYILL
jgi:hypothetical protein